MVAKLVSFFPFVLILRPDLVVLVCPVLRAHLNSQVFVLNSAVLSQFHCLTSDEERRTYCAFLIVGAAVTLDVTEDFTLIFGEFYSHS